MPIHYIKPINGHSLVGVWKLDEEPDFFLNQLEEFASDRKYLSEITNKNKLVQSGGARMLVKEFSEVLDFNYQGVAKEEVKAPLLVGVSGFHISLSHTNGYSAAIISSEEKVGIDIEVVSEKVERIKERFLNQEETRWAGNDLLTLTAFWCGKEVAFKIFHQHHLFYKRDIYMHHYDLVDKNRIELYVKHKDVKEEIELSFEAWGKIALVYGSCRSKT